ncbi:unnamed protein product [Clonostachys rhizophaga]|uniref:Uncharacterized protein n=1 Tax=Clonostachys rhizophaga TaxID=160324 RepID=A0A9N9YHY0_9HYPO|nr:unnamed protein product [Clonostachys rhizophaga]
MSDTFNNWFLDIVPDSGEWMEGIPPPPPLLPAEETFVELQPEEPKEQPTPEMLIEKANARLERLTMEGRKSYFGKFVSHLKYSEIDWSNWEKKKKLEAEAQSAIDRRMAGGKTPPPSPQHNIKRKFDSAFPTEKE